MRYKISLLLMYGVIEMCHATTFEIGAMIEVDNNVMKQIKEYMKQNKTNESGNENIESRRNIKDYIKEAVATMKEYDENNLCHVFNIAIDKVKRLTVNNDDTDKAIMKNVNKLEKIPCGDIGKLLNETMLALSGKKYKGATDWLQLLDNNTVWDNLKKIASSPAETLRKQSFNPDEVVRKTIRNILKVINKIYGYINEKTLQNTNVLRQHKGKPHKPTLREIHKSLKKGQHKPLEKVQHRPSAKTQNRPLRELKLQPLRESQHKPSEEVQLKPSNDFQHKPSKEIQHRPPEEVQLRPSNEVQNKPSKEVQHRPSEEQSRPSAEVENRYSEEVQNRPLAEAYNRPSKEVQSRPPLDIEHNLSIKDQHRQKYKITAKHRPSHVHHRPSLEPHQSLFTDDYSPSTVDQEMDTPTPKRKLRNRHRSKRTRIETKNYDPFPTTDTETTVAPLLLSRKPNAKNIRQKIDEQRLDEVIKPIINILLGGTNNSRDEYTTTTGESVIILLSGEEQNPQSGEHETTTEKPLFKNNRIVLKFQR